MKLRSSLVTAVAAGLVATAAAQTVTVSLTSSMDGQTVSPGAMIDWSISFTVSGVDNEGLALLVTDLVQDAGNPDTLDIPPADAVPAAMANFSRPDGITNPPETDPTTGYTGVQRGPGGAMNLLQIGGAQNTFGVAKPPGTGVAENANVVGGVGQGGPVTLASGSFPAPSGEGVYVFSLENTITNVIDVLSAPPAFSQVIAANVVLSDDSFSFTVGAGVPCPGDCDSSGNIDITDLGILLGGFNQSPGTCDTDGSGSTDISDLGALLSNFNTICP